MAGQTGNIFLIVICYIDPDCQGSIDCPWKGKNSFSSNMQTLLPVSVKKKNATNLWD